MIFLIFEYYENGFNLNNYYLYDRVRLIPYHGVPAF